MANPARRIDEHPENAPRATDQLNPVPPRGPEPLAADARFQPANDPRVDNSTVVATRSSGNGVLIAALVVVLAVVAYFIFAPSTPTTGPVDQPAATTSEPAGTAPANDNAAAPAATAPADTAAPAATDSAAPATTTPAAPATNEAAPATGGTAPNAAAPADQAPATTPAAPAQ